MAVMTMERPTSEDGEGHGPSDDHRRERAAVVRALHDQLDPPEGYRIEIIEGKIEVAATPMGRHAVLVRRIRQAVERDTPPEIGAFENITLEEPEIDRYIPDLAVWPEELVDTEAEWVFAGEGCLLAVEVTSPDQERRDYAKADGYARSGTPIYLLVDRKRRTCIVFSEPAGDRYMTRHEVPFGKPVTLPLDPPITLETADF
jgi:Uma2 family endonuclease